MFHLLGISFADTFSDTGVRMGDMNDLLGGMSSDGLKEAVKKGWDRSSKTGGTNTYEYQDNKDDGDGWFANVIEDKFSAYGIDVDV